MTATTEPTKTRRAYGVKLRRSVPLKLDAHPSSPDEDNWHDWVRTSPDPIAIDLFAGAGGLSQGLYAAGYRVALAVDMNPWAIETHAHNLPGAAKILDLADETARKDIAASFRGIDVDLVAGGPPCQPFSRAGRSKIRSLVEDGTRDEHDLRRELWRAFLDVVDRIRPRAVLIENVPDMAFGDNMAALHQILSWLTDHGYDADARILETWKHGVPQHRQRLIIVGVRTGTFTWPEQTKKVTIRDAISDLPVLRVAADSPVGAVDTLYSSRSRTAFIQKARDGAAAGIVHDHVTRAVRPDDLEAFKVMSGQTRYTDLPEDLQRYRADIFTDKYHRLSWDGLSRTITAHIAKDGYWYIHPDQHRTLTIREAARLQTFPDRFRFAGSRSHQFHQIGNAVPPALAEALATSLLAGRGQQADEDAVGGTKERQKIRNALKKFARADARTSGWLYSRDRWEAMVGLVLGARGARVWPQPAHVLQKAPTPTAFTDDIANEFLAGAADVRRRDRLRRLRQVARTVTEQADTGAEQWLDAAHVGPADRSRWLAQTGEVAIMNPSTASLRVVARLTSTTVDKENKLSAGRLELAKLVGGGEDAATMTTALHQIGTVLCRKDAPRCDECPLRQWCSGIAV